VVGATGVETLSASGEIASAESEDKLKAVRIRLCSCSPTLSLSLQERENQLNILQGKLKDLLASALR
jgi:hypothetical protein